MTEQETLLPIGQELALNSASRLYIVRRLSAGLTGEVYQGQLHHEDGTTINVAVKAMKSLGFAMARQLFDQESQTLAMMQGFEEEVNKKQRLSLKVAPAYYGRSEWNETPYFVMEFIEGTEIPELISQKQGFPSEVQALTIAWHLYRTLDIMHNRLHKTYIDLKFENLWWVGDPFNDEGQLKLTDFGTLEDIKDSSQQGIQRDLLLAAVYLCIMVTGHTLNYSLGRLHKPDELKVIRQAEMSWGTRHLLLHLLHRTPEMRPTTATEVARELRILVNFWHSSAADLTGSIELNSEKAHTELDNDKRMQFARRARSALDIAIRCQLVFPAKVQEQLEAIENILKLGDPLQYGQDLLTQGKYKKAREELEKAKHWSEDPAVARHWVYTAHIGEEVSDPIFSKYQSQLFDLIETLNQANWGEAEILLSELSKSPLASTTGLKAMQAEYDLFSQKNEAERLKGQGDYEQAANCFRKAQEALGKLPDREFVDQEELGGTLLPLIEEMELKQRTVGRAKAILAETKQELRNLYN